MTKGSKPHITRDSIARWQLTQIERLINYPVADPDTLKRRLKKAEELLTEAYAEHGTAYSQNIAWLWEDLSAVWFHLGDPKHMKSALLKKAELEPGNADAFLNLGFYLNAMGFRDEAKEAYMEGLKVNPADEFIIYNLASIYETEGQRQSAILLIDKAIQKADKKGVLLKAKADLLQTWNRPDLAAAAYEEALRELGDHHLNFRQDALRRLASCYHAQGKLEATVTTWKRLLALNLNTQQALYNLTILCHQLQDYSGVIKYGSLYKGEHEQATKKLVFKAHGELAKMK